MNLRVFALLIFLVTGAFRLHAQDPMLSIKSAVPLFFNPAYAGNEYYTRIGVNYRNHYPVAGNTFATYSATFDIYADKYNSGFGLMLMSDQYGSKTFAYNSANIAYSYKIELNETSALRAGLAGNLYYGINDPGGLAFPDMINPDGTVNPNQFTYDKTSAFGVDFGAGILYDSKRIEAGAAAFHIGGAGDSAYWNRPLRIYAHAELKIPLFTRNTYTPQSETRSIIKNSTSLNPVIYYLQQGLSKQWGVGASFNISTFKVGIYSRQDFKLSSATFSGQVGYSADIMEICYMFDLGMVGQTFRGISTASHELCFIFKIPTDKEN